MGEVVGSMEAVGLEEDVDVQKEARPGERPDLCDSESVEPKEQTHSHA